MSDAEVSFSQAVARRDLTSDGLVCPAKAVLRLVSGACSATESNSADDDPGFEAYARYFQQFLFSHDDLCMPSILSAAEKRRAGDSRYLSLLRQLYHSKSPSEEPAFFSFYNCADLSRLSLSVNKEFVVYCVFTEEQNSAKSFPLGRDLMVVYHDERGTLMPPVDQVESREIEFFLLVDKSRLFALSLDDALVSDRRALQSSCECFVSRPVCDAKGRCLDALWTVLSDSAGIARSDALILPAEGRRLSTPPGGPPPLAFEDFGSTQGQGSAFWREWGIRFALYAYTGVSEKWLDSKSKSLKFLRSRLSRVPSHHSFSLLTTSRPEGESNQDFLLSKPIFVVVVANRFVARASPLFVQHLAKDFGGGGSGEAFRQGAGSSVQHLLSSPLTKPSAEERSKAYEAFKLRRKTSKRSTRASTLEKTCRCSVTCAATDFDDNMSRGGPERLMTNAPTARDLINTLGISHLLDWQQKESDSSADSDDCVTTGGGGGGDLKEDALMKATNLCVSSMDIESRTVPVAQAAAVSGCCEDLPGRNYDSLLGGRESQTLRFVQRPVMLDHVDQLTVGLSACDTARLNLVATDDSETAVFELFERYWDYVLMCQRRTSVTKARLLLPVYKRIEEYKRAFYDYCASWKKEDDSARFIKASAIQEQNRRDLSASLSEFVTPQKASSFFNKKQKAPVVAAAGSAASDSRFDAADVGRQQESPDSDDNSDLEENSKDVDSDDDDDDDDCISRQREIQDILREAGLVSLRQEWPEIYSNKSTASKNVGAMEDLNARAWRKTLPGQLEARLDALVRNYTVFSFYGSGYDQILLLAYLVPRLFELGFKPKVERRGNKITAIHTRNGVSFRDVTKLLAPSMNLRKFGQLFGLQQKKAHFPFSILTSVDDLKRESLPASANDKAWRSELTMSHPSQEDVDEALRLFSEAQCANLGDYLKAYLRLDVEILQRATIAWKATLYDLIGLDFVDARKFTISSLSYDAGLRVWERNLRIGCFFPNNSQHYRILRRAMRGGLCSVFRSIAGGSEAATTTTTTTTNNNQQTSTASAGAKGVLEKEVDGVFAAAFDETSLQDCPSTPVSRHAGKNRVAVVVDNNLQSFFAFLSDNNVAAAAVAAPTTTTTDTNTTTAAVANASSSLSSTSLPQSPMSIVAVAASAAAADAADVVDDNNGGAYANNAHWLAPTTASAPSANPSKYVGYYDAASLYPSSGTSFVGFFFHFLFSVLVFWIGFFVCALVLFF